MKRIIAALSFFTRLPFWRLCDLSREHYERVIPLWPLAGWLTGSIMMLVFMLANNFLPVEPSIMIAIAARVLTTGALHEDGFADFCDGFGGGTTRERTLEIMKDSHIGTYGVLGLVIYYMLFYTILSNIAGHDSTIGIAHLCLIMVCVDPAAKMISGTIIYFLPYARKASEAKNKLVYASVPWYEKIISIILGLLPAIVLLPHKSLLTFFLPTLVCGAMAAAMMFYFMRKRIQGYTGDCCGATFIIVELVLYLTIVSQLN